MTDANATAYRLTVRPAEKEPGRYEYVISRRDHEAVRSDETFPTHESAKAAGDARGHQLAPRAASTAADD